MQVLVALLAGLLFGLGLTVSGMINPAKVLGFLDIAGDWDPSLAFVMAGAVAVAAIGFAIGRGRKAPAAAISFAAPAARGIDVKLVLGAVAFGIGWGLAGFCPGPALACLAFAGWRGVLFTAAMLVGMAGLRLLNTTSPSGERSCPYEAVTAPPAGWFANRRNSDKQLR